MEGSGLGIGPGLVRQRGNGARTTARHRAFAVLLVAAIAGSVHAPIAHAQIGKCELAGLCLLGQEFREGDALFAELGAWGFYTGGIADPQGFDRQDMLQLGDDVTIEFSLGALGEQEINRLSVGAKQKIVEANAEIGVQDSRRFRVVVGRLASLPRLTDHIRSLAAADRQFGELVRSGQFRVVTAVAKAYDHEAQLKLFGEVHLSPGKVLTIPGIVRDGKFVASTGLDRRVSLDDGVTIAYIYSRPCWNGETLAAFVEDRIVSYDPSRGCPTGTRYEPPKTSTVPQGG